MRQKASANAEAVGATSAPLSWTDILGRINAATALVTAWLFLVGWSYFYYYLDTFGVGLAAIGIDPRQVPIWGWLSFREFLVPGIATVLFTLAAFGALSRLNAPRDIVLVAAAATVGGAFLLAIFVGRSAAENAYAAFRAAEWRNLPSIRVYLRPDFAADDPVLSAFAGSLHDGCHRLLYQDGKALYLLRPILRLTASGDLGLTGDSILTTVFLSDVAFVQTGKQGLRPCRAG